MQHHRFHRNVTNNFHCGFEKCSKFFEIEVSLRSHVIRKHCKKFKQNEKFKCKDKIVTEEAKYICTLDICRKELSNYSQLIKHLKRHILDNIKVKCPYKDCNKFYNTRNSFTGHLSKKHRTIIREEEQLLLERDEVYIVSDNKKTENDNNDVEMPENKNFDSANIDDSDLDFNLTNEVSSDLYISNVAQFFFKLVCQFMIPASTIEYIASAELNNYEESRNIIKQNLKKRILKRDVAPEIVNDIVDKVFQSDLFSKSHTTLKSGYKRNKFYKNNLNYVEPQAQLINTVDGKNKYFYYVPISETIKGLYKDKSVISDLLFQKKNSKDSILIDIYDGEAIRSNKLLNENSEALQIILYQDSFEIVNPIGSAKKKHKLLAVYLSFGNLPDHLRSYVNNIKLVALCKEKEFNYEKIYGKIVEDLKIIETRGVEVEMGKTIKGTLVFIAGDNLGSHSLGGFLENFSKSNYFCRYCLVTKKKFHEKDEAIKTYPLRTVEGYKNALDIIKNENLPSYEGIKFDSIFNELNTFHVCNPDLPPCLAHDLFEGVIAFDLKLFIDYFVTKKWFSFQQLNKLIDSLPYSTEDRRDKPSPVEKNKIRILGNACQVWQFLRLFPLLIENYLKDAYDDIWILLLLLSEITEIVCAPALQESVRKAQLLNMQQCNKVCVKGTSYNKGDALCVRQSGYQCNVELGIICRLYEIGKIIKYECLPIEQTISYEPMHIYIVGTSLCVKPKFGFVAHNSQGNYNFSNIILF